MSHLKLYCNFRISNSTTRNNFPKKTFWYVPLQPLEPSRKKIKARPASQIILTFFRISVLKKLNLKWVRILALHIVTSCA